MSGINGPFGPINTPRPTQQPAKSEQADADLRQQQRGDPFDARGSRYGRGASGEQGGAHREGTSLEARASDFSAMLMRQAGAGESEGGRTAASPGRLLAERIPKAEASGGSETPLQAIPLPGGAGQPAAAAAPTPPAPPAAPDIAAKVQELMATIMPKIESLGLGPRQGAEPVEVKLPLNPASHGLTDVQVTMSGTGPGARIEVVLVGPQGGMQASLAAAAHQLADRLHERFPKRIVSIVEGAAEAEPPSGQAALSSLFSPPPSSRDGGEEA